MDANRLVLYDELRAMVGNTPLVVILPSSFPRGNMVLAKLESESMWGGHYDRVYPDIFLDYEQKGRIRPDRSIILETSTGNAGISTAAVGTFLGYETHLGVPASVDQARKDAIKEHGGIVHEVEGDYVNALPKFAEEFRRTHRNVVHLHHDRGFRPGENNEVTLNSLGKIADESIAQVTQAVPDHPKIDYFVAGIGNGSTLLGPGRRFKEAGTRVYGTEPFSSAVLFEMLHPGLYERLYGIPHGSLSVHNIYGLSWPGLQFPHIGNSLGVVEDSILIGDKGMQREALVKFSELSKERRYTDGNQHRNLLGLPRYGAAFDSLNRILVAQGYNPVGRSSAVGFAAAVELSAKVENSVIMFLCYDRMERYSNLDYRRLVA